MFVDPEGGLRAHHTFAFAKIRFLGLHYKITPREAGRPPGLWIYHRDPADRPSACSYGVWVTLAALFSAVVWADWTTWPFSRISTFRVP